MPCNNVNIDKAFSDVLINPTQAAIIAIITRIKISIFKLILVKITILTEIKSIISVKGFNFIIPFTIPSIYIIPAFSKRFLNMDLPI